MPRNNKSSRKYRLAMLFSLMILAVFGMATLNPILPSIVAEIVGGLVAIFAIYCGGNVVSQAVLGKYQGALVDTEQEREP